MEIFILRFFAHDGFKEEEEKGGLWPDKGDLNVLYAHAGLKCLPEI